MHVGKASQQEESTAPSFLYCYSKVPEERRSDYRRFNLVYNSFIYQMHRLLGNLIIISNNERHGCEMQLLYYVQCSVSPLRKAEMKYSQILDLITHIPPQI